jgi:hypothetical protein
MVNIPVGLALSRFEEGDIRMLHPDHRLVQILVREEVEAIVLRAARGAGFLRAGEHAYRILKTYPNCGMTGSEVVNEIVAAAATAGVAVEISQPEPRAA